MQGERSSPESFPEQIDLNQGAFPKNTSMDHSNYWDNTLNPVENQLSNSNRVNPSFSGWDRGESSSSANNMQNRTFSEDSKMRPGWSEDWCYEPSNITNSSYFGNMQNYRSNFDSCDSLNLSSNHIRGGGAEQIPAFYASSSNDIGASSGSSSTFFEMNNGSGPGPSLGTWGSSCKRKALEGSSNPNHLVENMKQNHLGHYIAPGNLSISSRPLNLSLSSQSEPLNPRNGVGTSRVAPPFPDSSRIFENPGRNRGGRLNTNTTEHEPVPFEMPRGNPVRHSSLYSPQQISRSIASSEPSDFRSPNMLLNLNPMHVSDSRGPVRYPWNGNFTSQSGSSSSSFIPPGGEMGSRARNLPEPSVIVSPSESRTLLQDEIDWSFSPGNPTPSRNYSSGSRVGWLPIQMQTSQNRQRSVDYSPRNPVPLVEYDSSGSRRSHFAPLPSGDGMTSINPAQRPSGERSFFMDLPAGDEMAGWRSIAAVEGRRRLIRQVLSAMRRGVHVQAEDYMLVDPFINAFAEFQDRHRDMRLDVDNMSYEELLALEDRIGNVSTGLSEEKILGSMKQRKFEAIRGISMEPCCICREDYIAGDNIGISDCGHEFHTHCIKQWLIHKNLCPICKTEALGT